MPGNVYWGTHSLLAAGGTATLMGIGDSWLWYPFGNLAAEVGARLPNHTLLVVGRNGAEAADWAGRARRDIDVALRLFGAGVQALLLSGGGNDLAGADDLPRLLRADCRGAASVADCWRPGEPDAALATIEACFRALIVRFRAVNPHAPVVVHPYDHAWPSGEGVFGPATWLKAPMDAAGVPEPLRRGILRALVQALKARHLAMADEPALGVVVAATAGVLPDGDRSGWANELLPTPAGFRRLARQAVLPALHRAIV